MKFKRCICQRTGLILLALILSPAVYAEDPVSVGNRLQLFVDDAVVQDMSGDVTQQLVLPEPREVVFVTDEPWEGNTSGYYSLFQDRDIYRMIYRGWQHDEEKKAAHHEVTCYAESRDGVHWTKPNLGLFEWEGSKDNNIVWIGPGTHNFTAFHDTNPATPATGRYKALGGGRGGLIAFESPDCIHWKQIQAAAVITNGAFDSQNLAFWDESRGEYRAYWRYFGNGVRAIRTATSQDFMTWHNETDLSYVPETPVEHLYTNAIQKYFRAPDLFVGFPTRFDPKTQQVEPVLMTSRDGTLFRRSREPVVPQSAPQDRNHNRSNYMTWGMFQLPDSSDEISVYATENYYEKTPGRLRRFVYRVDGFKSIQAGVAGGTMTTRMLSHSGEQLCLNYVVAEGGSLTVEVLNAEGKVVGQSESLTGDAVAAAVKWQQDPDLGEGIVSLRFTMKNVSLYSLHFD